MKKSFFFVKIRSYRYTLKLDKLLLIFDILFGMIAFVMLQDLKHGQSKNKKEYDDKH